MDLDIENYNTDELCQILELNKDIITPELLKNNLLVKIKIIETADESEIQTNKVELINFYVNSYFKLLSIVNNIKQSDNTQLNTDSKLDEINKNLMNINQVLINNNILNENMKKIVVEQSPHYVIQEPDNNTLNVYNQSIRKGMVNPIYRQTLKKYININTRFRDNYVNTSSTDFTINMPGSVKNVLSMKIYDYDIPFTVYSITDKTKNGNNFKIIRDSSSILISIDPGAYTFKLITKNINKQLSSNSTFSDIVLTYIETSGKFTFEGASEFTIDFFFDNENELDSNLSLGWILGFRGQYIRHKENNSKCYKPRLESKKITTTQCTIVNNKKYNYDCDTLQKQNIYDIATIYINNNSYTGEGLWDPHFNTFFLLSINDFMNNHNNIFISPFGNVKNVDYNLMARLPSTMHNDVTKHNFPQRIYFGPTDINRLEVKLYNEYGKIIDNNFSDYSFVLEIEVLYEK